MEFIDPTVLLIANTETVNDNIRAMAIKLGMDEGWNSESPWEADALAETAGRLCYKSFKPGLNPNVNRIREDNHKYVENILKHKHGAVLEHGSATFAFIGVSRILTHELVRHRAGMAYSQESLRYVRLDKLQAYYPEAFKEIFLEEVANDLFQYVMTSKELEMWAGETAEELEALFTETFEYLEAVQKKMAQMLMLDNISSFATKKKLTSAMRRLAPMGLGTNIIATGNHRSWRHLISMRANEHAEEEIDLVFREIGLQLKKLAPATYQDLTITDTGAHFKYDKV